MRPIVLSLSMFVVGMCLLIFGLTFKKVHAANIEHRDVIGKTFKWQGKEILVTDYGYQGSSYTIIINFNGQRVAVNAEADSVFKAYTDSITTNTDNFWIATYDPSGL